MNLIHDRWLPVFRADGAFERIAPWQITEPDNPVRQLAAPRADFNGALMQWLIALLQTAAAPDNQDEWGAWMEMPPAPEVLRGKFDDVAHAFDLNGDGPCFMQDYDKLESDPVSVSGLLIDAPGNNALKNNTDLFVKRGGVEGMCPACAAQALFTLQTNAPSGGVGHRTGLRGGGPLTTLVKLDPVVNGPEAELLWPSLWLNVFARQKMERMSGNPRLQQPEAIFPWLAPTRTSEKNTGCETTPDDAHPLQMYWAMPRRIRLDFDQLQAGTCDICAGESDELVSQYQTRNYGVNYTGAWQHPLSPYSQPKPDELPLPLHAQPGGISYRHWPSLTVGNNNVFPAANVEAFSQHLLDTEQLMLQVFGFDMDNMKARCWYECTVPLYLIDDAEKRARFAGEVQRLVDAAVQIAGSVRSCVKEAWFKRPADAKGDMSFLVEAFYQRSESAFYAMLDQLHHDLSEEGLTGTRVTWHGKLCDTALGLFDEATTRSGFEYENPARIANARKKLGNLIHSKKIRTDLGLPTRAAKAGRQGVKA
jgi:CRISPR system Cascade subunit CasA